MPLEPSTVRRILAVKLSSFGDIVHVTPCLRALRGAYPEAEILVAVDRTLAGVLRHDSHIDGLVDANPRLHGFLTGTLSAAARLAQVGGARFDVALDFQGLRRSAAWVYASRARWRGGRGGRRPGWQMAMRPDPQQHAIDVCAGVAERAGVPVHDRQPRLYPGASAEREIEALLGAADVARSGFIVANPFGIWPAKRWPIDRWAALIRTLSAEWGATIIVTGSRSELTDAAPLLAQAGAAAVSLVGRLTLEQAICLYHRAALLISGDSGPLHAAAAVGTPVVALYGPTWPERTGPRGSPVRIIQVSRSASPASYRDPTAQRHMRAIEVERVLAAAAALYHPRAAR